MLQDKIDNKLKAEERTKEGISGSCIGECPRKLWCRHYRKEHLPLTAQQRRVFKAGDIVEDFCYQSIKDIVVEYQKKVEYRGIPGIIDFILKWPNGLNRLTDTKSVNSKKFEYLNKEGIDERYKYQVGFYWLALKGYQDLDPECTVYYVEKDTLLTKEMAFKGAEMEKAVNKRIDQIDDIKKGIWTPNEKTEIDWECFSVSKRYKTVKIWCQYIENCPYVMAEYYKAVKEMGISPDSRLTKDPERIAGEINHANDQKEV